jgi:hypothetical protein
VATPTTRALELAGPGGPAGIPVSVQVTSAGGSRPVIVLAGGARALVPFVERLARAGFATVACDPRSPAELTIVLDAFERGALGVDAASYAVLEWAADGAILVSRVPPGGRGVARLDRVPVPGRGFDAMCAWLVRELR